MNLTSNAIKFTDSGDVIVAVTVESQSSEEATIRVAVTDTGIGIPEEARERLFQSFSQADGSTTRKYGGTGLGLAICKRLVEMMGGTIGVMSRVGQGSCFWFTVNLRKQVAGAQDIAPSTVVLAGLRVLIVDEKAINRRSLEQMTKTWDMRPTCVRSGSEALDLLSRESKDLPFDLALLDMGSTDGIELVQAIKGRAEGARPRLVLLTSLGRRGDAKMAKEAGVAAYLTKPIGDRQLLDCLVAVMAQARTRLQVDPQHGALPLITRHSLAETEAKADLRILLAEDNIVNQKVAVRLFQRLGYRIDVVANGRGVVDALSRIRYDAVFMDCQMPDMDGFEATHVIRGSKGSDRVPIIAMTANAMQGDRERCLAAGMDDYISKPISVDALARALDRVSQERRRVRSKKSQAA